MTTPVPAHTTADSGIPDPAPARRRIPRVLVASQVLSGAGLAAGALLAQDLLGSTTLAGLPSALSTAGSALAAPVLWLRPGPLLLARTGAAARENNTAGPPTTQGQTAGKAPGAVVLGALVMVLTQLVMVAIMTMTPVHMLDHGHSTATSGLVAAATAYRR
ncbi:hypothetical protein [Streptomyces sp. NPDC058812]|uniref:hypothetical protein n=1 Tax=unclassified Streptomyces TaxID=2593676 RepID=UPI003674336C